MPDNLKDILANLSTDIDQETLLLYLQDKLSPEKKHEIEKKLMENEFADDALEGLQQFRNKESLNTVVNQLNHDLSLKLRKKRKKKTGIHLKEYSWLYLAVVIIIILLVISYFVVIGVLKKSH